MAVVGPGDERAARPQNGSQGAMQGRREDRITTIVPVVIILAFILLIGRWMNVENKDSFDRLLFVLMFLCVIFLGAWSWRLGASLVRLRLELYRQVKGKDLAIADLEIALKRFGEVSHRLSRSLEKDRILGNVREALNGIIPCDGGFLFIKDFESGRFKLVGSVGGQVTVMNTAMLQGTAFDEDYAPLKAVLIQGTTLVVEDVSQGDHFLKQDVLDQAGLSCVMSMACVPFMVEKEVLGAAVYFAEADKIKKIRWDHPRWSALVQQVSVALGSAVQNELAVHDRLTRLHNHGFFHEALSEAMKEARGFLASGTRQGCLSLIMLDVDHFKQFNDTYGHQTGDRVLKQIAGILRRQCNPNYEIAARYGGEEFAVILKMMPLASSVLPDQEVSGKDLAALGGAVGKAEMIRRRIEEAQFMEGDKSLKVTVSLGVGCWRYPQDENIPKESFIKIVDDELYRAKKSGRNRVCYWCR